MRYVCKYKVLKNQGMNEVIFKIFDLSNGDEKDVTEEVFFKVREYAKTAGIGSYSKAIRYYGTYKQIGAVMVKTLNSGYPASEIARVLGVEHNEVANEEYKESTYMSRRGAYFEK